MGKPKATRTSQEFQFIFMHLQESLRRNCWYGWMRIPRYAIQGTVMSYTSLCAWTTRPVPPLDIPLRSVFASPPQERSLTKVIVRGHLDLRQFEQTSDSVLCSPEESECSVSIYTTVSVLSSVQCLFTNGGRFSLSGLFSIYGDRELLNKYCRIAHD